MENNLDEVNSYILAVFLEKGYKNFVDVGSGYGNRTALIAQSLGIKGTGIDVSKEYIKKARARHPDMNFRVQDARTLKKGRFDVALTHGFFIHVEHKDIEDTIKRVMNVAKNGLFIESSYPEGRSKRMKYNPKAYWDHRALNPEEKNDLPMKYYYSHDYVELFNKLDLKYQMVKRFDLQTRMFSVWH